MLLGTYTLILVEGRPQGQPSHWHRPWQGTSAFLRDVMVTSCLVVEAKLWNEKGTLVKPLCVSPQLWHQPPLSSSGSYEVFLSFSLTCVTSP